METTLCSCSSRSSCCLPSDATSSSDCNSPFLRFGIPPLFHQFLQDPLSLQQFSSKSLISWNICFPQFSQVSLIKFLSRSITARGFPRISLTNWKTLRSSKHSSSFSLSLQSEYCSVLATSVFHSATAILLVLHLRRCSF